MTCQHCQCDEQHACPGGCFWILPGVCSLCALKLLGEAGLDTAPILAAQQLMREVRERVRSELAGGETGAPIALAVRRVTIPFFAIAAMLNPITGWVSFLHNVPLSVPDGFDATAEALAADTLLALNVYDELAAIGSVPSRAEIGAMYQAAGTPAATVPAPAPARLWRPGDSA